MDISIFGLGYVGSVACACLAKRGHGVVGVDVFPEKIDAINRGEAQISEPGLDELISEQVAAGQLRATGDAGEAVAGSGASFICVGTPSLPDGGIDLSHVEGVVEEIAAAVRAKAPAAPHAIIFRSTMVPGSTRRFAEGALASLVADGLAEVFFFPEFLRQGTAIADFDDPSASAVGCADPEEALGDIEQLVDSGARRMSYEAAELLKYACNAFHAVKVDFANEIGRLGKRLGIDSRDVMAALCSDTRLNISPYYLRPGNPFGGSCLPKDVSALTALARAADVDLPMLGAVVASNREHIQHLLGLVRARGENRVVFLGLTFKQDTDDLRGSAIVEAASTLLAEGFEVAVFDPWFDPENLVGSAKALVEEKLPDIGAIFSGDLATVMGGGGTVVVSKGSVQIPELAKLVRAEHHLIDLNGWPELESAGLVSEGICW